MLTSDEAISFEQIAAQVANGERSDGRLGAVGEANSGGGERST